MKMKTVVVWLLGGMAMCQAGEMGVSVIRSSVVNDTVPNAQTPTGLVRVGDQSLVAIFSDAGDLQPGAKAYLVRSDDLGVSWSEPYKVLSSDQPNIGLGGSLVALPGGKILLIENEQNHHSEDRTWNAVFKGRSSTYKLFTSTDGGKTFEPAGTLPAAPLSNGAVMGTCVTLPNGDLILPAYQYSGGSTEQGHAYGSGFFRSKDGGKTWGALEVAFADKVPGREKPLGFSEAAYVVRPDNSIVAYARIDSEVFNNEIWQTKGNNMWYIESKDNGLTWSMPTETKIGGIFPAIVRLGDSRYLLACGDRHATPTRKTSFYTSPNGLDFQFAGFAPYVRTKGECLSPATGGSQCLVVLDDQTVYMIYYAADPAEKTLDKTYIEGCQLSVDQL